MTQLLQICHFKSVHTIDCSRTFHLFDSSKSPFHRTCNFHGFHGSIHQHRKSFRRDTFFVLFMQDNTWDSTCISQAWGKLLYSNYSFVLCMQALPPQDRFGNRQIHRSGSLWQQTDPQVSRCILTLACSLCSRVVHQSVRCWAVKLHLQNPFPIKIKEASKASD